MKKIVLLLVFAIILSCSALTLSGCAEWEEELEALDPNAGKEDESEVPEAPVQNSSFVFGKVTLNEGESMHLLPTLIDGETEHELTYTTESENIKIQSGRVKALSHTANGPATVKVTAEGFEASFTVSVREKQEASSTPNYGQLIIKAPETIYTNYPGQAVTVSFSNSEYRTHVSFTSSIDGVFVQDNEICARGPFPEEVTATITAKTDYHEATFNVKIATFSTNKSMESKLAYYEYNLIKSENKGGIIFVGDSYFDGAPNSVGTPPFWTDFYTDYSGEKAFLMGISSAQITDLEMASERIVYAMEPAEIVVHIGFNDVHHGSLTVDALAERICALLTKYHQKLPNAKVYYCGVEPKKNCFTESTFFDSSTVKAPALMEKMRTFASSNSSWCTFVDTASLCYTDTSRTAIKTDFYIDDLSHPTLASYDSIRALINTARGK